MDNVKYTGIPCSYSLQVREVFMQQVLTIATIFLGGLLFYFTGCSQKKKKKKRANLTGSKVSLSGFRPKKGSGNCSDLSLRDMVN